jgi:hypothetical protein
LAIVSSAAPRNRIFNKTWRITSPCGSGLILAQQLWRTVVTGNTGTTRGIQIGNLGATLAGTTNTFNSNLSGTAQWSVSRISNSGGVVWHQSFAGPRYPGNSQTASGVVSFFVDSADNVFVYGSIPQPTLTEQVFGKFANDGTLQFIKNIPSIYLAYNTSSISNIAFNVSGAPYLPLFIIMESRLIRPSRKPSLNSRVCLPYRFPILCLPRRHFRFPARGTKIIIHGASPRSKPSAAAGRRVRVQYSVTPFIEASWTDIPGGGADDVARRENGSMGTEHESADP